MKYNDIILLLLILTFVLLSVYYIGCVCEFNVSGIKEAFTGIEHVGDTSCLSTTLVDIIRACPGNCSDSTTTFDALKKNEAERNYHTDYTCANIMGSSIQYSVDNNPYKYDIRNQHLLLTYKCVKLSPIKLQEKLESQGISTMLSPLITLDKVGTGTGTGTGLDTGNIRHQITNMVKNALTRANKTQGPIYACISQAPYLKGQKARFDIVQHGKGCYDNGKACGDTVLLKYQILLIFLDGDSQKINKFIQTVNANSSRNALCFLNCGGLDEKDSLSMGCGCLNVIDSYTNNDGSIKYDSVCLAPDSDFTPNSTTTNKNADYSIIYFLNPHNNDGVIITPWEKPVIVTTN